MTRLLVRPLWWAWFGVLAASEASARSPAITEIGHAVAVRDLSILKETCHLNDTLSRWPRGGVTVVVSRPKPVAVATTTALRLFLVTALVTLVFEAVLGHVLELVKIQMQTSSSSSTTYAQVLHNIVSTQGVAGLWSGFVPWGVVQAVSKGAVFGWAHATARSLLVPLALRYHLSVRFAAALAGGIAGGVQGLVLSPTLLLKTRVMTQIQPKSSLADSTWQSMCIGAQVIRSEGVSALMKGSGVFATKRVFDWASRYYFSDVLEALMRRRKRSELTVAEKSAASFLGGVASTLVTLPLDVLVAKLQDAKKAGETVSAWALFLQDLERGGWSGLFARIYSTIVACLPHHRGD
jgi:Mitochondrial carrier protein